MTFKKNILSLSDLPFNDDIHSNGGKIFSVGGAVRDEFLGKESKDLDILVTGIPMDELEKIVSKFGKVDAVGKSFGVLKFIPKGSTDDIDIAIPRTETPTGEGGHQGFDVKSDHTLPIEKDLERRDFTINAIAKDIDGNLIDPFNGQDDLKGKIIRVVNPDAFSDDPLRMLRAIQFSARFDFMIEKDTMNMIKENASRINEISGERILIELDKIVVKGDVAYGADLLRETGLYKELFGENPTDNDLDYWDTYHWDNIRTMGEFFYLLAVPVLDKPSIFFKKRLKGDIDTVKEIEALEIGLNSNIGLDRSQANISIECRMLCSEMYKKSPKVLESDILGYHIGNAARELVSGRYPKTVKDLAVNGNDLIELGFKGKDIGDTLDDILFNVYSRSLNNIREEILLIFED